MSKPTRNVRNRGASIQYVVLECGHRATIMTSGRKLPKKAKCPAHGEREKVARLDPQRGIH